MDFNIAPQRSCRSAAQLSVAVLTATMLSACSQTTATPDRPASRSLVQQSRRKGRYGERASSAAHGITVARCPHGVASFYKHGSRTASGEKFNPGELTAAHRTLPFGTRVRVTDVATGKSVTVRVNDRGPFINGRVIDVSHAAAESLGMTGKGVAKVKLDVVQ